MSGDPNKNLNSDELSYDGDMGKSPLNLASKVASRKSPDFGVATRGPNSGQPSFDGTNYRTFVPLPLDCWLDGCCATEVDSDLPSK